MINFLDEALVITGYSCEGTKYFPVFQTVKFFIVIIQITIPFALIIWGSLDWFKALIAHDEKEMRIKRKPFVTRVIFAMLVLILPWLLQIISDQIAGTNDFWKCYSEAKPKIDFSGFELDEDSGNLSGTTTGKKNSPKSTTKKDKNVTVNCGLITEKAECNKSKTSEKKCTWKSPGYCTNGDKIKIKCNDYSYDECPDGKKDDYGKVCAKDGSNSTCGYKVKKQCKEYDYKDCPIGKKDDYGNTCDTVEETGSSMPKCDVKK